MNFSAKFFTDPWPAWTVVRLKRHVEAMLNLRKTGHLRSALYGDSVDSAGNPVPWYSQPAVEFLNRLDLKGVRIFEWGAGNSTLYYAARGADVWAIESNDQWAQKVRYQAQKRNYPYSARIQYAPNNLRFSDRIYDHARESFDLICVDCCMGPDCDRKISQRGKCVLKSIAHSPGAIILLDNADWLPQTCLILRDSGYIEIPFIGIPSLVPYQTQTSVFLPSSQTQILRRQTVGVLPFGLDNQWEKL